MADAFGNEQGTVTAPEPEVIETDQVTPQGTAFDVQEPEPTEVETSDDWTAAIEDDDLRQAVGSKYGSPTELAKAYRELEGRFGSQGNEISELRQMVTELLSANGDQLGQAPQQGQQPQSEAMARLQEVGQRAGARIDQLTQKIDNGEINPGEGVAEIVGALSSFYDAQMAAREEQLMAQIDERLGKELEPVHSTMTQQKMGGQVSAMQRQYGEQYATYAPRAAELLREWGQREPAVGRDPRFIATAFQHAELEHLRSAARESNAHTLDGTGPGPAARSVDPAALILEGIERAGDHSSGDYF